MLQELYPVGAEVDAVVHVRRVRPVRDRGGKRVLHVMHCYDMELPLSWFSSVRQALKVGSRYRVKASVKWYQVARGQTYMVITRLKWRHMPFPGEPDRNADATLPE